MTTKRRADGNTQAGQLMEILVPGGAVELFRRLGPREAEESRARYERYALLSSISAAMRERAADQ